MGKIVKYCAACDESFAEKFGFCPNCGQAMTAFEMNPVVKEAQVSDEVKTEPVTEPVAVKEPSMITIAPLVSEPAPVIEPVPVIEPTPVIEPAPPVVKTAVVSAVPSQGFSDEVKASIIDDDNESEPEFTPTETKTFAAAAGANGNGNNQTAAYNFQDAGDVKPVQTDDGGYRITMVEEKNVKQRNLLLLGSLALMLTLAFGGTVYSLFNKDLMIGAIGEEGGIFIPLVDEPMPVEEEPKPKNDDDGGGGGGGGKENPQEATKGRLPNQVEKPVMPPQPLPQVTNASLPNPNVTQGTIKRERTTEPVGTLNGIQSDRLSSGTGRGGGIGNGNGEGIGGGNGTGEGNGNGSGSGNGNGNGNGDGTGNGTQGGGVKPPPPPPSKPVGPTEAIKITFKPQPKYTDAARQNNISGTVTLKVTFTSSGQIGSISPVNGLPYGLTEQAISAARQIRFDPPKKNGVPYTVAKTIAYTFTIY